MRRLVSVGAEAGPRRTVRLELLVRDQCSAAGAEPPVRRETIEMSEGVLDAMLER